MNGDKTKVVNECISVRLCYVFIELSNIDAVHFYD